MPRWFDDEIDENELVPELFQLVDYWDDDADRYFTVDLGNGYKACVKFPRLFNELGSDEEEYNIDYFNHYSYIMDSDNIDGGMYIIFDAWNRDERLPDLEITDDEYGEILYFVDENATEYVLRHS